MALTDTAIHNVKPKEKLYKVADAQGLHLLVNPKGSKLWRVKYRINGVERRFVKLFGGEFGKRPVTEITPQELLHELRKHEPLMRIS